MIQLLLIFIFQASATTKIAHKTVEFNSQKVVEIRFDNSSWNKDSTQIDTGLVILRDAKTNKVLQIPLEETGPNTGIFSGTYSVDWGGSAIKPQVYVLDQNRAANEKQMQEIVEKIESGTLKRQPLFYRKTQTGVQTLQVFNTKDEMLKALEFIKMQNKAASGFDTSSITSSELAVAKAIMTSEDLKKFVDENRERRRDEQKKNLDRFRQKEIEKKRIDSMKKRFEALAQASQEKLINQASEFAKVALDFYRAGDYAQAEVNFQKSFDLNPSDIKYYFQYAISLFKNKKYDEAIVAFSIAQENKDYQYASLYYKGLSEFSLMEYGLARIDFSTLAKTKDGQYAPLANFYEGVICYDQKEYKEAKEKFQIVLDTSKDPKLDRQAEKYIENADRAIEFALNKQKKTFLSATVGGLYDSNVLQQSSSSADQGAASDKGSLRYILGTGIYYRPIMNDKYEFGPKFRTDYVITQNNDLSGYDPLSVQFIFPFAYKTNFHGRPTKIDVKPGYELLYLGQTDHGHPLKTLNGKYIEVAPTIVMKENWLTTISLLYRKDSFYPDADQGENADKITLRWTNTLITDTAKTKSVIIDGAITKNDAVNSSYSYFRYDLSALYLSPTWWDNMTFAAGPGFYSLNYRSPNTEHDFNTTINATLTKQLTTAISGTILSSYVVNKSNTDTSKYDKWTLGVLFSADYGF